jgi:antitoxin VapB
MGLDIKNEEAHRLARELARVTGESLTVAVSKAIRERLERIRAVDRILKIARACAPLWKEPFRTVDHGDLLYDEKGLPK